MNLKRNILPATFLSSLLFSVGASAQPAGAMNEQQMQEMMSAMQEVQSCFQQIDRGALEELQERSQHMTSELKSLCQAGDREQAQDQAMDFYKTMQSNEVMEQVRECSEKIPESLKQMAQAPLDHSQLEELEDRHVCDLQQPM